MAKVILLGDIRSAGGKVLLCDKTRQLCRSADAVIANLEGPVVENAAPRPGQAAPRKSSASVLDLLVNLNVTVVTIANNHILDYGVDGLRETIAALATAGIRWVGASAGDNPNSHFLDLPELNAVLFAFAHREGPVCEFQSAGVGPVALPGKVLHGHIREWKRHGRRVLVSYHGGEEYYSVPWPRRAAWAESIAACGADIVFGHHSHSVQPIVRHGGSFIIHGTGNFYLDSAGQRRKLGTDEGLLTLVEFKSGDGRPVMDAWKVRADWDKQSIRIANKMPDHFFSRKPEELDRQWIAEASRFVWTGKLKQRPLPGMDRSLKKATSGSRVAANFIWHNLKRGFSSVRDRDILMSALPLNGKRAVAKMRAAAHEFRF